MKDSQLITAVNELSQHFPWIGDADVPDQKSAVQSVDDIHEDDPNAGTTTTPISSNFRVVGISFNWLGGAAQGSGGTVGGPGSIPVPLTQAQAENQLTREIQRVLTGTVRIGKLEPHIINPSTIRAYTTSEIEIVILDTLNPIHQLAAAFKKYVLDKSLPNDQHRVLRDFFGGNPGDGDANNPEFSAKLNGEYLTFTSNKVPSTNKIQFQFSYNLMRHTDSRLLMDYLNDEVDGIDLVQYPHKVADHGLFVAGTIRDYLTAFAPDLTAHIHVVQVLSDYGIGTLGSLEHGLNFVLNNRLSPTTVPLVINCSLMMAAPRFGHVFKILGLDKEASRIASTLTAPTESDMQSKALQSPLIDNTFKPIEDIINKLHEIGGINIIAAAGNERLRNMSKPSARYPAAFKRVMGVGATKWDNNDTDYTNERDGPPSDGANVPGGEVKNWDTDLNAWITDELNGVPGVYISDFPLLKRKGKVTRETNENGWAAWAGTSFAAPRATAAIAILRAIGDKAESAVNKVKNP